MNYLKTIGINTSLCLISLFTGLIIGEIGLRIAQIEYPLPPDLHAASAPPPFYIVNDPYRGWGHNPNARSVWTGEGERSEIYVNSGGFRDQEYAQIKPENTYRIAILGDSFIEALHVPLEKTSQSILEIELGKCPILQSQNKKVEVLNFGVQGYGTAQQLMTLRHHVWQYSPDLVILAFYPGNDVRNNYRPLEHDHLRPYFVESNGKLVEDLSFRELSLNQRDRYAASWVDSLPRPLISQSRILQLLRHFNLENKRRQFQEDYEEINISFYKEPPNQLWEEAWNITEKLMVLMRDEVEAKGAKFMLFTVSDSFQVNPDAKVRENFMKQYDIVDLFYPTQRIEELGERENITVFSLARSLGKIAKETGQCLHGFANAFPCGGHWNLEGNQVAGELMANYICQQFNQSGKTSN